MINTYSKAYTEVLEILSYFSQEEYSKIPKEKVNFYKENMDKNYIYKIDPTIDLSEQYISKEANAILISLFRDYFATESQKKTLKKLLSQNQERLDKIKKEKYNSNNIFNKAKPEIINKNIENNKLQLIEYKKSFFSKFIRKFLSWKQHS